ncbi:putative thiol oxidoreductase [Bacteroidales bacterium Barb6]|nr:putative thiol oxidoreductase [Bacteroidales bacterium Barb6]
MKKNIPALCLFLCLTTAATADNPPFFTTDIALNASGEVFLAQKELRRIDVFSPDRLSLTRSIPLYDVPTGLLLAGDWAYVTTFSAEGQLQIVSLASGKTAAVVPAGSGACAPTASPDGKRVYVCNQYAGTVSEIDVERRQTVRTVRVLREPKSAVVDKSGRYLYVANFLPVGRADADVVASCVSVIDLKTFTKVKDIPLANGSNALRSMCITPDGKYIYVSHNLGRFTVPTSQLQQGWMNTSAFSIIDTHTQTFAGAILADEPERGAAGIWGIACNEASVFVLHSGTHEVSVIDHKALRRKFEQYPDKAALDYDLNFLYGIRRRIPLEGNGPRYMALAGDKLLVPTYFADILNVMDIHTLAVSAVNLNPARTESSEQKGEKYFNDASNCFQNWQSCNGCHPGDARMDGMNWDLMNDGVGNSKNCKSLLFSHATPACMISGIRDAAETAVDAGFRFIQFFELDKESLNCVNAYLKALQPVPSPYLVGGKLSAKAEEGRKVFDRLNCGDCHSGTYYTDMKLHRIGEDIEFEHGWDTPALREVWRTAPYLFDGRAANMKDVFETHRHGIEKAKPSRKDIEALTEYVNSL